MSKFADNLRKYRKRKKYSQEELAKSVHFGYTAIANYESGRNEPSLDVLIMLAKTLDVTTDELIGVELTAEEDILLSNFKKLSSYNRNLVLCLVKSLLS